MNDPVFSIIIPLKELNDYVNETVNAIQKQGESSWEIFVVTNETQATRWPMDGRIKMMASGRVGPADKRDLAARSAKGRYLVFLDDDSYPGEDFLRIAHEVLTANDIDCLGGPAVTPSEDGFLQRVSGASFLSRITGGAPERYRPIGEARLVDDWPSVNFIIKSELFLQVGGFDSPYWPGEDTFLCWKLKKFGAKIMYHPDLVVWHHRRPGLRLHLKQISAYGLHRGYFTRRYPENSLRLKYFAPLAMVVMNVVLSFVWLSSLSHSFWVISPISLYLIVLILGSIEIVPQVGWRVALVSVVFVFLTHHVYAINFGRGLFRRNELVSKLR